MGAQRQENEKRGEANSLDIIFHQGKKNMPACIFIHGLGMNKNIWVNPSNARIMGGLLPLSILLQERAPIIRGGRASTTRGGGASLYHDLKDMGYTVVAWSQSRPTGPIDAAVEELRAVIDFTLDLRPSGIILIGHSRGGLIARATMSQQAQAIVSLITLSTPHLGSSMAKWAVHASSLIPLIKPLIPKKQKGAMTKAVKRILDFLESRAVRELLPGSDFLRSLKDTCPQAMYCISAGGTNPDLISINGIFSIPGSFEKLLGKRLPEEMIKGKGDGLVSLRSSVFPGGNEHLSFPVNHAQMVVDREVRKTLIKKISLIH